MQFYSIVVNRDFREVKVSEYETCALRRYRSERMRLRFALAHAAVPVSRLTTITINRTVFPPPKAITAGVDFLSVYKNYTLEYLF